MSCETEEMRREAEEKGREAEEVCARLKAQIAELMKETGERHGAFALEKFSLYATAVIFYY